MAGRADAAEPARHAPEQASWTGFYIGGFLGGGSGEAKVTNPFGASVYGGQLPTPFTTAGLQLGYGYRIPDRPWVIGLEIDGGGLGRTASNTCLSNLVAALPANCRIGGGAMATGTVRLGYLLGPQGRLQAYAKAGVAGLFGTTAIATADSKPIGGPFEMSRSFATPGFTIGAGLEEALTGGWSSKVEYDYADFGSVVAEAPTTAILVGNRAILLSPGTLRFRQDLHTLKIGVDYRLGEEGMAAAVRPIQLREKAPLAGASFTLGLRDWYSFGRFQKDLGIFRQPSNVLVSRLTYADTSDSGEIYGRVDTAPGLFLKGLLGIGRETGGTTRDEDFLVRSGGSVAPYSNTLSQQRGTLDYGTLDLGSRLLSLDHARIGAFAGYNFYRDDKTAIGCEQTVATGGRICVPALPTNIVGITENDIYHSLRLGTNVVLAWDRLRLEGDAAFLPLVVFRGSDTHWQRFDVPNQTSPESGTGQGVQLELFASYALTPALSVGVGGRMWSMWVPHATTNAFSQPQTQPLPVTTERYGVLAQLSYRFGSGERQSGESAKPGEDRL